MEVNAEWDLVRLNSEIACLWKPFLAVNTNNQFQFAIQFIESSNAKVQSIILQSFSIQLLKTWNDNTTTRQSAHQYYYQFTKPFI